jgi:hypothetical protein
MASAIRLDAAPLEWSQLLNGVCRRVLLWRHTRASNLLHLLGVHLHPAIHAHPASWGYTSWGYTSWGHTSWGHTSWGYNPAQRGYSMLWRRGGTCTGRESFVTGHKSPKLARGDAKRAIHPVHVGWYVGERPALAGSPWGCISLGCTASLAWCLSRCST